MGTSLGPYNAGGWLDWPLYNTSTAGTKLVFNTTFYLRDDNLANAESLLRNKVMW